MGSETLIIVVGGDYLAFEICKEILKTAGHAVVLVWKHADERAARLLNHEADVLARDFGSAFTFLHEDPIDPAALRRAGLQPSSESGTQNYCLVAVSQDDRLNLRVALLARDINEHVRITLRQFNPVLGYKIQEGLALQLHGDLARRARCGDVCGLGDRSVVFLRVALSDARNGGRARRTAALVGGV